MSQDEVSEGAGKASGLASGAGGPNRRQLDWSRVRGARGWLAIAGGTAMGAGLFPKMPGTFGSLIALPLAYWSLDWDPLLRLGFWGALLFVGTWSAKVIDEQMGTGDHQTVVMDEVVGIGISTWTLAGAGWIHSPWALFALAFVLFRIFDIVKVFPVGLVDRWSKTQASRGSRWWGGFGVMADDFLAGFQALACLEGIRFLFDA